MSRRIKAPFAVLGYALVTLAKLLVPGGLRIVAVAPLISPLARFLFAFWELLLGRRCVSHIAVIFTPSSLWVRRDALKKRKYGLLHLLQRWEKPGPKEPSPEVILGILEMKRWNRRFG